MSWVVVPSALIAVATLAQMLQVLRWPFVDLPAVSALPMASLLVTGPIAAAAAAWMTSRTWSPGSPLGSGAAARSGHPLARRQGAVMTGSFLVAFVASTLPVILVSDARAAAGEVQWGLFLYAVAALVVFTAIGFVIGAVFPYRLTFLVGLAVAALLAVVEVYIPSTRSFRVLVPVESGEFYVGDVAPAGGWLVKAALVLAAGVALLWCAGAWPEVRYRRSALVLALAPLLAAVGGAGALVAANPVLHASDAQTASECETPVDQSGPTICVPAQQVGARDIVRAAVSRTLDVVGGRPTQLDTVSSDVLNPYRRRAPVTGDPSRDARRTPSTVWVTLLPEADIAQAVERSLISYLSGAYACSAGAPVERLVRSGEIDQTIQRELDSGGGAGGTFATWYSENQASILACSAPPLPPAAQSSDD